MTRSSGALLMATLVLLAPAAVLAQDELVIGSLDGSRSRSPFATSVGNLGYAHLRGELLDPANFGPGADGVVGTPDDGIASCRVIIAPGAPVITDDYLNGKNVLFTSVFTGDLTVAEQAAVSVFVARGGTLIVDANSVRAEQTAASSLLAALPSVATLGPNLTCANSAAGGTITENDNLLTNGPFGDIRGGTFGTSPTAINNMGIDDLPLMNCGRAARSYFPASAFGGLVMYGGDPSAFDLFTVPASGLFNPNNEVMYLSAFAAACSTSRPRFVYPVGFGECAEHALSSYRVSFDMLDPGDPEQGVRPYPSHTGEDWNRGSYDTDLGDPVCSVGDGVVVESENFGGQWGNIVLVRHELPGGVVRWSQYAHLQDRLVQRMESVTRGQRLGSIGKPNLKARCVTRGPNRGRNCAHLHFEIRQENVEPNNWPGHAAAIRQQYLDPTDIGRDTNSEEGFIERRR